MKVKSESEVAQSCPTLSNPMDCRQQYWSGVPLPSPSQVVLVVKNPSANAEDMRCKFDPGMGRSFGEELDKPPQYSCLKNPKDIGA